MKEAQDAEENKKAEESMASTTKTDDEDEDEDEEEEEENAVPETGEVRVRLIDNYT